jgi:hypothetical protein
MENEKQVCFGSNDIDVASLVNALALALDRNSWSLERVPSEEAVYVNWYGHGDVGGWVHCSAASVARELAKSVAAILGNDLSLYEAFCELTNDTGDLTYQARTISAEGKVMPKASTSLDGENLEAITAGYVRDRLSQILDVLKECERAPTLSHSFRVFSLSDRPQEPSSKADSIRENRIALTLSELESGISATLARYDGDTYEFKIQTAAGYLSTIYTTVAEKKAIEEALTDELRAKLAVATVHGPLCRTT